LCYDARTLIDDGSPARHRDPIGDHAIEMVISEPISMVVVQMSQPRFRGDWHSRSLGLVLVISYQHGISCPAPSPSSVLATTQNAPPPAEY
jgi:hypothetical protein